MNSEDKFKITGLWNGEPFEKIMEAEDENDAASTFMLFASLAHAQINNLNVVAEGAA
ncbi:hypothetical protein [Dryocola clanedunensis]